MINSYRFKKLTVEERVNCLSTTYPQLVETFLTMHQKIGEKGESSFAMIDNRESERISNQFYHYPYYNIPVKEPEVSVFEKTYYQREMNSAEIDFCKSKEHDK